MDLYRAARTTPPRKGRGSTWRRSNLRRSQNSAWIDGSQRARRYAAKCWPGRTAAIRTTQRSTGSSPRKVPGRNCTGTTKMCRNLFERPLSLEGKVVELGGGLQQFEFDKRTQSGE